ncbi:uncharacterized protein isoform X2 [Leptinotarsa decemlineata]|uniref:uncharacterized protein isoform X2 n=1 Tax=Leptinotarsa decemlineata TaxID=7539 RepID=UPI003D307EBB
MGRKSVYKKSRVPSRRKKNRSILVKKMLKQKVAHNAKSQENEENPSHLSQATGISTTVQANPSINYDDTDESDDSDKDNSSKTCDIPTKDSEAEELDCCDIEVEVSQEQESTPSHISGRRIFDIQHLFAQLLNGKKHELCGCDFTDCVLISEHRQGLYSEFLFKCKMCGITETITTEKCQQEATDININSSVAVAAISTGIGFSQIEELATTIDMPMMSSKTFNKYHDKVSETILTSAWSSMVEAGQEEAKLARDSGEVDSEGIPFITVVTDGAWCKRSYNVNYDASSGVACIIGYRTGKILYLGVRNKYCTVCARSQHKGVEPPEHKCFKNWSGTSTAMETDIIVEGFKCSLEMHGPKYMKMIGDGDSSVHNKLLESRPYGHMLVQKIECKNYLLRNFISNLREITTRRRSNSKNMPVPYYLRKEVSARSMRLRTAITKAALHRMSENISLAEKIKLLEVDIRNAPSHVFGEHAKCKELQYFKCNPKDEEVNLVPSMKLHGLYSDVEACLQRLVQNCSSLILNMDNNMAEHFNSIVCKFVGGERINFSLKGSYQARCEAAALSFNSGGDFHGKLHHAITGQGPTNLMKKYSSKMKKRRVQVKQRNQQRRMKIALPDKDYGPESNIQPLGVDDVEYIKVKEEFLKMLEKKPSEIEDIQRATLGQSGNPRWI